MRSRRIASFLFVFITLCFIGAAVSQQSTATKVTEAKTSQKTPPTKEDQSKADPNKEVRVSIVFPGGTLDKYLAQLKDENRGSNVNVIAVKEIRNLDLPDFTLKNAPLAEAVGFIPGVPAAIHRAVTVQPLSRGYQRLNGGFFISGLSEPPSTPPTPTSIPTTAASKSPDRQFRAYSLKGLTDRTAATAPVSATQVQTTVAGMLKPADAKGVSTVQYNDTTGLLVVYGTPSEQSLASQLIEEMTQTRRQATATTQLKSELDTLKAQVKRLEGELADLKKPKEK